MKKIFITSLVLSIIGIVAVFSTHTTSANPSVLGVTSLAQSQSLVNPLLIASSSATYIAGSATTTFVTMLDGYDQADLNLYTVASSTASSLNFQIDFSDDYGCYSNSNACNWYREDLNTTSGTIITHTADVFHTWTPGKTSTSTKNITIGSLGARFMRISFGVSGGNVTLWAQTVGKNQRP